MIATQRKSVVVPIASHRAHPIGPEVVPVNVSVTQPYFREAMRAADDADVIIVMMHIGPTQPEYTAV
jgi:hypothetical protein